MGSKKVVWFHLKRLLILFALTFGIILPILIFNYPFSKLYDSFHSTEENLQKARNLNKARVKRAREYFSQLNKEGSSKFYEENKQLDLDIVVVIVTVKRKTYQSTELGYLFQTASAMDKILKTDKNLSSKMLLLCNVDQNPITHVDAEYLKQFMPIVYRYRVNASTIGIPHDSHRSKSSFYSKTVHSSRYEKETIDYMFCLEAASSLNPKYVLLLEDDTVPDTALFDVLHYKLNYHSFHSKLSSQEAANNFAYVKLYYPQRWQGYAFELTRILEVISIGCVGAGIFVGVLQILYARSKVNISVYYIYFFSGCLYFILFTQLLGRQNLLDIRRFSRYLFTFRSSPGCCTQAMLYPHTVIPTLLNFLEKDEILYHFHTDLAIYRFVTSTNIQAYQIEPNLFYHIGMYTSLSDGSVYKNPSEFIFNVHV